jgi:predicted XRE-type DNA-binding protein
VKQQRLNDLLKTRITKFSLDALINHATLAGLDVKVKVGKAAA